MIPINFILANNRLGLCHKLGQQWENLIMMLATSTNTLKRFFKYFKTQEESGKREHKRVNKTPNQNKGRTRKKQDGEPF
jgi:hypothetical protein